MIIMIMIILTIIMIIISNTNNCRKGTTGVSTKWGHCIFLKCFSTGTFWALPLTDFYLPKSARAYFFPNSSRFIMYVCIYIYIHTHTYTLTYTYVYIHIYIYILPLLRPH